MMNENLYGKILDMSSKVSWTSKQENAANIVMDRTENLIVAVTAVSKLENKVHIINIKGMIGTRNFRNDFTTRFKSLSKTLIKINEIKETKANRMKSCRIKAKTINGTKQIIFT